MGPFKIISKNQQSFKIHLQKWLLLLSLEHSELLNSTRKDMMTFNFIWQCFEMSDIRQSIWSFGIYPKKNLKKTFHQNKMWKNNFWVWSLPSISLTRRCLAGMTVLNFHAHIYPVFYLMGWSYWYSYQPMLIVKCCVSFLE